METQNISVFLHDTRSCDVLCCASKALDIDFWSHKSSEDFLSRGYFATSVQLLFRNRGSNFNVQGKWGGKTLCGALF